MAEKAAAYDVARGGWSETRTCVVLGGRGFIGRTLVNRLLRLGGWIVRVADSSSHSLLLDSSSGSDSLLSDAISSGQASFCHVDVLDTSQIVKVTTGADVVFYMEPKDLDTHDFCNCYMIIVQGAKNVINACRESKVKRLVYNSSVDVVFDGSQDILNGDESFTHPGKFKDMTVDLKFQAEGLIRLANNIGGLQTCVLRPSNVFGPGETQFVPLLANLAKFGLAKFITGSGGNMSDFTYVENVAHAHICAAETIDSRVVSVAGKAFFITNLDPIMFWEFISLILEGLGYQRQLSWAREGNKETYSPNWSCQLHCRPFIKVPTWMVSYVVILSQYIHDKLGYRMYKYSVSPHYIVQLASRNRTFDCSAAQKHLGYSPVVSLEDGIKSTVASFSHLSKDSSFMRFGNFDEQSKAEKLLGSGIDVLLWRDERKTFMCFLILALAFYWFFFCGKTFTSSAAQLLLLVTAILYGYGILASDICAFAVQKIPSSCFEIQNSDVKNSIRSISYMWNRVVCSIRLLAKGEDWSRFFKVVAFLYLFKWIVSYSLAVLVGIVLVFAFTAFFIYEQYESVIKGLWAVLLFGIMESKGLIINTLPDSITAFLRNNNGSHQEKAHFS
ncbi:3beta-hydroxysteroid-dehydrogenase/decarboxylase isoform 3-like isoform X2 [Gossypium australe]|uniref:Reticulon-like protein n=1 Tax=Gossypium australe TaxID=47621 RepID=A0A5B6WXU3_9ROSI|nr:3beta-hydroxysteroid-dehydrogenase/decarboxylase isoform 3-like isoform X2 [Gossypium australe]